jgi:hypothetical protein
LDHDNGNRASGFLSIAGRRTTCGYNDIDVETDEFLRKVRDAVEFFLTVSKLNDNVFPLDITKLAQNWRNASVRSAMAEGEALPRYAMRGMFGCCASAKWMLAKTKPITKRTAFMLDASVT